MIYTDPIDNVIQIVRDVGIVEYDQLAVFFSADPQLNRKKFEYYITWLQERGMITIETGANEKKYIVWFDARKTIEKEREIRTKAFWVVAYFGSALVYGVNLLKFPLCFEVILDVNGAKEVVDIAVCNTTVEATIVTRELLRSSNPDEKDNIVHLVVVPNEEVGQNLEPYGFDCFVVLRNQYNRRMRTWMKVPEFFQWEEGEKE